MKAILVSSVFILLHGLDGETVYINPDQIVALKPTREGTGKGPNQLIAPGAHCSISLSNGKAASVIEDCPDVEKLMERAKKED